MRRRKLCECCGPRLSQSLPVLACRRFPNDGSNSPAILVFDMNCQKKRSFFLGLHMFLRSQLYVLGPAPASRAARVGLRSLREKISTKE